MFPECIFENSLENLRKNWSFEKYLECYILYVKGVLNFLLIAVWLTFQFISSWTIHCFYNSVCEYYCLMPDILRYCLFLTFQLDRIDVYVKGILGCVYNLSHLFDCVFQMMGISYWVDGWVDGPIVSICFESPGVGYKFCFLLPTNSLAFSKLMI